jgi:hypothetical protein
MRAVLAQDAPAPPKRFAGGGYWEAMKGDMTGWFEVRVDGPRRHHYRYWLSRIVVVVLAEEHHLVRIIRGRPGANLRYSRLAD